MPLQVLAALRVLSAQALLQPAAASLAEVEVP